MKTLTQQEYSALPIEKRRYWKRRNPDDWTSHDRSYIPIQINLEDAEGVMQVLRAQLAGIEEMDLILAAFVSNCFEEALNKLKGV